MMPIKPGSTTLKEGKMPIIERTALKIFVHGRVVRFASTYHQFIQSKFKLKTAKNVRSNGLQKSIKDGMKGKIIAALKNIPAAKGA